MQLITLAAAAIVATVSANSDFNLNSTCNDAQPKVRIYNKCSYDVNLWSVLKGQGCPSGDGAVLKAGSGMYQENYRTDASTGVSIKLSKSTDCKGPGGDNSAQLEYFIQSGGAYSGNYLDVSYVDCAGGDCPTRKEGFYLKSGNQNGVYAASTDNTVCPILSCTSAESCNKVAYVNPDDVQTKSCDLKADLVFYMCGQEGSGSGDSTPQSSAAPSSAAPASSSSPKTSAAYTPAPSSSAVQNKPSKSNKDEVAAAAVTSAAAVVPEQPHVKTEVVYVTAYEYTYAKRHAHGHRHQHFRA